MTSAFGVQGDRSYVDGRGLKLLYKTDRYDPALSGPVPQCITYSFHMKQGDDNGTGSEQGWKPR